MIQREATLALPLHRSGLMIRETAILVGVAVAVPFLIHLIPAQAVPWGARLLPMFYAPLLGVLLFRLHVGLIPAALAPAANALVTGSPATDLVVLLTVELVVFALVAHLLLRTDRARWMSGPVAYLTAKIASMGLIALLPWFAGFRPAGQFALTSVRTALPGLLILMALTVLALQMRSRSRQPSP